MRRNGPSDKGFTMVELLVVVAIVAALGGIAFPVGRSMLAKGREGACMSNLRSMGVGLQAYVQDNNNRLPTLALGRKSKSPGEDVLETVLARYIGDGEVFHCPADHSLFAETGCSYNWNITQNGLRMSQVEFLGIKDRPEAVPLVSDKESWHPSGTNFLYADSSISNKPRFVTGSGDR